MAYLIHPRATTHGKLMVATFGRLPSVFQLRAVFLGGEGRGLSNLGKQTGGSDAKARELPGFSCQAMALEGRPSDGSEAMTAIRNRVKEIITPDSSSSKWDECWQEEVTPWDLRGVTPIIQQLVDHGHLPEGRALVPGCGLGYDVLALASDSRHVVGLDISETASKQAQQLAAQDPRGKLVQFVVDDFFKYTPESPFNLVFDYTFFCAINPELRPQWASKTAELLASDGELITLMFPLGDFEGGPPYAVSVEAYEQVLNPLGLVIVSCEDNELSVAGRKGKEKVARWKKTSSKI